MASPEPSGSEALVAAVRDARTRTLDLVADLADDQLMGPRLAIVNPLSWEIGHVAWFQEKWTLRRDGSPSLLDGADALYDSAVIAHDSRWDLPLPSRERTLEYMHDVLERSIARVPRAADSPEELYYHELALAHEDMHDEAFTYTRQTLGYPPPIFSDLEPWTPPRESAAVAGDVEVEGGEFRVGAARGGTFVHDNEKWEHTVRVPAFRIARTPVTQSEFAAFVDDDGYGRRDLWSDAGWTWKEEARAEHPAYWRRSGSGWERRDFDRWVPLEPRRPIIHLAWYEADAWCRWAGRRLPAEAEWEMAASWDPRGTRKRRYPWGDAPPTPETAHLDGRGGGCTDVATHPLGESPVGCRHMIGNVWEWTADAFVPYPEFAPDPYKEYSQPWFHTHRVLRGGCWATRSRLIRNTWRNFYTPERRDVLAGFRTCALR